MRTGVCTTALLLALILLCAVAGQGGAQTTSTTTVSPNVICGTTCTDNPPTVSFYTIKSGTIRAAFTDTVHWCDDHGLNSTSRSVTLNGTALSTTWFSVGTTLTCTVSDASAFTVSPTTAGSYTVYASINDNAGQTGSASFSFTYDPRQFSVSPKGASLNTPAYAARTDTFTVKNYRTTSVTYGLSTSLCTSALQCTAPNQVTVAGSDSAKVFVSYTTPAYNTSGVVKLIVTDASPSTYADTGSTTVTSNTQALTVSFANLNNDDQQVGLCAATCFAAALSHSTLAYRSLGAARAVTLLYNGDRTAVRPVVTADVTIPYFGTAPDTLTLRAWVNGTKRTFVNGDSILRFVGTSLQQGKTYRLAGQFDARDLSTGMATLQVTVYAKYANDSIVTSTTPSGTKLMVVNLNSGGVVPLRGWTVAGVQQLYKQTDTTVLVVEGDGSGVYFNCAVKVGATPCQGPSGDFSTLSYDGTNYTRAYPDSSQVIFNGMGQMTSVRDRWGNTVSYTYTTYNGAPYLSTVGDPVDTAHTLFSYGTSTFSIIPPGAKATTPDSHRALTVAFDANGNDTTFTDPDGHTTKYTYDGSGRVATITDRRGGVEKLGYDATTWKLIADTLPAVPVDTGGGNTQMKSPILLFRPWQTLAVPLTSTASTPAAAAELDTAFALVMGAVNDTSRFTADRWGQPLISKDPLGNTSTIQRTGIFATTVTDILGNSSTYQYSGPFLKSASPFGQGTTTYAYDAWGMVDTVTPPHAPQITYTYTGVPTVPKPRIVQKTNGAYPDTTFLDPQGRVTSHVDPAGHVTTAMYDAVFGNLDSLVVTDTAATGSQAGTHIDFDGFGRDSVVRGYNAPVVTHLYDLLGRDSLVYASAGAQPTRFIYDPLFLLRTIDPAGQVHKDSVNALGWPTVAYDAGDTTKTEKFFYDLGGRITTAQNRSGVNVSMSYDVAGRLLSKQGHSTNDSLTYAYSYSPTSQIIVGLTKNTSGTVIATDSIKLTSAGSDSIVTVVAGQQFIRAHSVMGGTAADTTHLAYSAANVSVHDRIFSRNTATGALSSIYLGGAGTVSFGYDNELLLQTLSYPAYSVTLTHDQQHLVTQRSYSATSLDSLLGRKYLIGPYGTSGRITSEWWRSGVLSDNSPRYSTRGYSYDATGALSQYLPGHTQLYGCTGCPGSQIADTASYAYNYDKVFNLASEYNGNTGLTDTALYAPGNRDTSFKAITYGYDADGNRAWKDTAGVYTYYSWNADGQLVKVQTGSNTVWYDYNAFGELFRRKTNGHLDRHYLWDQGQLVLEVDSAGTTKIGEYAYLGTDQPLAAWTGTNATPYFYAQDERGNTVGATTGGGFVYFGNQVESYHFSPWGVEEFGDSIPEGLKFGWKGLPWEGGTTQLYYVRHRWYDPKSRSFISEDPIGLAGGMNTYGYANNEPIRGLDPTGLNDVVCTPIRTWVPAGGLIDTPEGVGYLSTGYYVTTGWRCDGGAGPGPGPGDLPSMPHGPGSGTVRTIPAKGTLARLSYDILNSRQCDRALLNLLGALALPDALRAEGAMVSAYVTGETEVGTIMAGGMYGPTILGLQIVASVKGFSPSIPWKNQRFGTAWNIAGFIPVVGAVVASANAGYACGS